MRPACVVVDVCAFGIGYACKIAALVIIAGICAVVGKNALPGLVLAVPFQLPADYFFGHVLSSILHNTGNGVETFFPIIIISSPSLYFTVINEHL